MVLPTALQPWLVLASPCMQDREDRMNSEQAPLSPTATDSVRFSHFWNLYSLYQHGQHSYHTLSSYYQPVGKNNQSSCWINSNSSTAFSGKYSRGLPLSQMACQWKAGLRGQESKRGTTQHSIWKSYSQRTELICHQQKQSNAKQWQMQADR